MERRRSSPWVPGAMLRSYELNSGHWGFFPPSSVLGRLRTQRRYRCGGSPPLSPPRIRRWDRTGHTHRRPAPVARNTRVHTCTPSSDCGALSCCVAVEGGVRDACHMPRPPSGNRPGAHRLSGDQGRGHSYHYYAGDARAGDRPHADHPEAPRAISSGQAGQHLPNILGLPAVANGWLHPHPHQIPSACGFRQPSPALGRFCHPACREAARAGAAVPPRLGSWRGVSLLVNAGVPLTARAARGAFLDLLLVAGIKKPTH